MRRLTLTLLVLAAALGAFSGRAQAAYGLHPNGETTTQTPTFTVFAGSDELPLLRLYVSADGQMDSNYLPVHGVATCSSFTPTADANTYSCTPSMYSSTGTSRLAAGTYYWWLTYYRAGDSTKHIAGPMAFTVAAPQAPAGVQIVSPANGATVSATPTLSLRAPSGVHLDLWVSDSSDPSAGDGSPSGFDDAFHCSGDTTADGIYDCTVDPGILQPGSTYYWWAVVTVNGSFWLYGPQTLTIKTTPTGGGSTPTGGTTHKVAHDASYAPYLPSSDHYSGTSVKQALLGKAAYALSKLLHRPKTVAVACWSTFDWQHISGDNPDSAYSLLGFYQPSMPRWLQLSPAICRSMETLVYHRPRFTNRITADGVDTLTHEMIHALGVSNEAVTECFAMQLTAYTAKALGVPWRYAENLGRETWWNYPEHPPRYVNPAACREDGAWDIFPNKPSLPWHLP